MGRLSGAARRWGGLAKRRCGGLGFHAYRVARGAGVAAEFALLGLGVELDGEAVAGEGEGVADGKEGVELGEDFGGGMAEDAGQDAEAGAGEPVKGLALGGDAVDAVEVEGEEEDAEVEGATAEGGGASVACGVGGDGFAADLDGAGGGAGQFEERTSGKGGAGHVAATTQVSVGEASIDVDEVDAHAVGFELHHVGTGVAVQPLAGLGHTVEAEHGAGKWRQGVGVSGAEAVEGGVAEQRGAVAVGGVG